MFRIIRNHVMLHLLYKENHNFEECWMEVPAVMGREISRPDFPAGTRREPLSRPVSSRHFETSLGLVLSRIQFPENFKVLSCLECLLIS